MSRLVNFGIEGPDAGPDSACAPGSPLTPGHAALSTEYVRNYVDKHWDNSAARCPAWLPPLCP